MELHLHKVLSRENDKQGNKLKLEVITQNLGYVR